MIPLKLHLKNFMCYRGNATIDFNGVHLAVLAGDNGQGKSALLDAMTWALWGKARTNSADDLVTYGESEMSVQLDFQLSGAQYVAIRKRDKAGRGSSSLDLFAKREFGTDESMSGDTIRDTERCIRELLKLDYDTFVNSAFLRQGHADEFTTKPPSKRKQILADILGLDEYDRYAELARSRSRELEGERERLALELTRIREEVAQIPQIQEELLTIEVTVEETQRAVREESVTLQALQDERRELDAKQEALTRAERAVKEARDEIASLSGRLSVKQADLDRFDALIARRAEIEAWREQWEQARDAQELLRRSSALQEQSAALQREIDRERAALESQLNAAEATAQTHRTALKRYSKQEAKLAEAEHHLTRLNEVKAKQEAAQREHVAFSEQSGRLKAENEQLRVAMNDLKGRISLLASSDAADCPVCRQPLSADHQAEALAEAEAEGKAMGDRYRENQRAVADAQQKLTAIDDALQRYRSELREAEAWQRVMAEAMRAAEEQRETSQRLAEIEADAATLRTRLDAGDYAAEAQQQLAGLASETASLDYDRAAHDRVRETLHALATHKAEWQALDQAQQQRGSLAELVDSWQQQIAHHHARIADQGQQISALQEALKAREALLQRAREQQILVNQKQHALNLAQRQLGGAKQRLSYAEQHAARQPEVEAAHHRAVEERTLYEQLANAFGKRGVQAMIIESAIPEIEQEANELLDRMTNGRMSVTLPTLREAKSSDGMIETLDILIADEQGERSYETFSGGEAFRINFALRIALSKLLAHRAGTSLRTLVIDEGFGSQDAEGRDRLVEAISSVQDDFERILVITHIDELKDAFPMRIDVTKYPDGSRVTVGG